jgi:hypothetical protein
MGVLFNDVLEEILWPTRSHTDPDRVARYTRMLNQDCRAIALKESWIDLRVKETFDWDGSTPIQLPSCVLGLDLVWDDTYEIDFIERSRHAVAQGEEAYRYYRYPVGSSLVEVSDASFTQDSDTFQSDDLEADGTDVEGEYFYVEGDEQLYRIDTATGNLFTFSPAYRGTGDISNAKVVIRPSTTWMLQLVAPTDSELPTSSIDVYYWRKPDTLRDPHDIVPFPTTNVLSLRTLSRIREAAKLAPVTSTMVENAFAEAAALNPDRPRPRVVRGIQGREIVFSTNHYANRESFGGSRVIDTWQRNRQ